MPSRSKPRGERGRGARRAPYRRWASAHACVASFIAYARISRSPAPMSGASRAGRGPNSRARMSRARLSAGGTDSFHALQPLWVLQHPHRSCVFDAASVEAFENKCILVTAMRRPCGFVRWTRRTRMIVRRSRRFRPMKHAAKSRRGEEECGCFCGDACGFYEGILFPSRENDLKIL